MSTTATATTARFRKIVRNQGVAIPDHASLMQPGGYPHLRLAPLNDVISHRSIDKARRQLLRAEHARGNTRFVATGLSRLDPRLASELISVYVGLIECYPSVIVDRLNFAVSAKGDTERMNATTRSFMIDWPNLHAAAIELGVSDIHEIFAATDDGYFDRNSTDRINREWKVSSRSIYQRDALGHASISFSECLTAHPRCAALTHAYIEAKNQLRAKRGANLSLPPVAASYTSSVMVHEFGHAVDYALQSIGLKEWAYVIRALEDCILRNDAGNWLVSDRQLAKVGLTRASVRLINYPCLDQDRTTKTWNKLIRDTVGKKMAAPIGAYAEDWLDECFAEAFMQSIVTAVPETRERLAPFQDALHEVGLLVKRRTR